MALSKQAKAVLKFIEGANKPVTAQVISDELDIGYQMICRYLRQLVNMKAIRQSWIAGSQLKKYTFIKWPLDDAMSIGNYQPLDINNVYKLFNTAKNPEWTPTFLKEDFKGKLHRAVVDLEDIVLLLRSGERVLPDQLEKVRNDFFAVLKLIHGNHEALSRLLATARLWNVKELGDFFND